MICNADKLVVIVAASYPSEATPYVGVFVKNIAKGWSDMGASVVVVAPQNFFSFLKDCRSSYISFEDGIKVIRLPLFNVSRFFFWSNFIRQRVQDLSFELTCLWSMKSIPRNPAFVYCHFLSTACGAYQIAKLTKSPLFIGCGESNIASAIARVSSGSKRKVTELTRGFISNSPILSNCLESSKISLNIPILTVPNRADQGIFYPIDKTTVRQDKQISDSAFIIIFVGQFIERKGFKIVLDSLNLLENVKAIFIGKGKAPPISEKVIFSGSVSHSDLPQWLACANVFVLPTAAEGCSNAISEAMAMALPIISTDIPEVACQVFSSSSILIKDRSVDRIAESISYIRENYALFKSNALHNAKTMPKESRAETIWKWILGQIENNM
jgi:teichuronic acid biosynthesis glycosyltransferase TuaC